MINLRMDGVLAEIRSERLPSTNLECYRYASLLGKECLFLGYRKWRGGCHEPLKFMAMLYYIIIELKLHDRSEARTASIK
jgi:hypothetical protein